MRARLRKTEDQPEEMAEEGSPEAELKKMEKEARRKTTLRLRDLNLAKTEAELEKDALIAQKRVDELKGTSAAPKTDLDKLIADDEKMQVDQIRKLKAQEIQAGMKAHIAELEKQAGGGATFSKQAFEITPQMAQAIADQPPEKREEMLRIYTTLISANKAAPNDYGQMLLTMMMGFQKTNPDQGPAAMAAYAKGVSDQIMQGITLGTQIAGQNRQGDPLQSATQLLNVFSNMYEKSMMNPIEKLLERLQPQASMFEEIVLKPELFERAKQMGWFGGGGPSASQVNNQFAFDVQKFKSEMDYKIAEMNVADRRWTAEHNAELIAGQQRIQTIKDILAGPLAGILNAAGDVTRNRFGTPGAASTANPTAQKPPIPPLQLVQCPVQGCGAEFYMNGGQEMAQCPSCKTVSELVACPTQGCGATFLIPEGTVQFQCPSCRVTLADTARLEEMKKNQETQAPPPTTASTAAAPATPPPPAKPKSDEEETVVGTA